MKIKINLVELGYPDPQNKKVIKSFECLTDSPHHALQLYEKHIENDMQCLEWEDITEEN
ncbi:hypothetical protein M0R19_09330 [Candidatus Pacearchaeota archaeon]|nr:hypothetical protein [Candidatus Pacearchaeota archaeon]